MSLFKRVTLVSKSSRASDVRKITTARIATAPKTMVSQRTGTTTYRWQGVLDIPTSCGPCFDSQILSLEYFLGIQERVDLPCVHAEPIVLMCAPPRVMELSASAQHGVAIVPSRQDGKQSGAAQKPQGGKASSATTPELKQGSYPGPVASGSVAPIAAAGPSQGPSTAHVTAATAAASDADPAGRFDELNFEGMRLDLPPCESGTSIDCMRESADIFYVPLHSLL